MLAICKKKTFEFSQLMGVYSVFAGCMVTQLCSLSNVCVGGVDTRCVDTQSLLSVFTMLGTAVLSSLHSGVVVLS